MLKTPIVGREVYASRALRYEVEGVFATSIGKRILLHTQTRTARVNCSRIDHAENIRKLCHGT